MKIFNTTGLCVPSKHYMDIEARTRNNRRMDVVIDYLGEQFVVELKIWRGDAYNERGKEQLSDYLNYFIYRRGIC